MKDLPGNKVHFVSLGCPRNLVDTEVMLGILLQHGYEPTEDQAEADYLVVNTCGFLESARQESLDTISSLVKGKKPSARVIVTGCMAQKFPQQIEDAFPQGISLLGSGDVNHILKLIQDSEPQRLISDAKSFLEQGEIPRVLSTPKHYAYLKIAEGCLKRCSFCAIPSIKGNLKSKAVEQILREFKALLSQGVQEIILIAQDLGDYAKDRKEKGGLEALLREMLQVPGDYWIRLLYLYPDEITDELIEIMGQDTRVCRYLDMPIQHVNDRLLKAMRRKTSRADIEAIISKLRIKMPEIVIRTSLMVGFPSETDQDFEELMTFVAEQKLDQVGVFQYSLEADTPAALMEEQIDEAIKQSRWEKLMAVQSKVVQEKLRNQVGKRVLVRVDGPHPETPLLRVARTQGQCPQIDGQVILNDWSKGAEAGALYWVEITQALDYDWMARVLKPYKASSLPARSRSGKLALFHQ
jgi:ribosomal protein S12 methylthiotransferase